MTKEYRPTVLDSPDTICGEYAGVTNLAPGRLNQVLVEIDGELAPKTQY